MTRPLVQIGHEIHEQTRSQGRTAEEATANLKEVVELFLDSADPSEIEQRLRQPVFVTHLEIMRG